MLTKRSLRNRLFACVAAGGLCLTGADHVQAVECGCEVTCEVCPSTTTSCSCGCSVKKTNVAYRALDAVAGGIEKLLGLDKCGSNSCDTRSCDDACDAMMMEELMLPSPPPTSLHSHSRHIPTPPAPVPHSTRHPSPRMQSAPIYSSPTESVQVTPRRHDTKQSTETKMRMSQPRMVEPRALKDPGHRFGEAHPNSQEGMVPIPEPQPGLQNFDSELEGEKAGGSLFDALSNPFSDDEARVSIPRPIRPTNYEQTSLRPISKRPLSRSYMESSRRVRSVR